MKKLLALMLALTLTIGCACAEQILTAQPSDDQAARYAAGMALIAEGRYAEAYTAFLRLAGYEDADTKAYELGFANVAELRQLTETGALIVFDGAYGLVDFSSDTVTAPQWSEVRQLTEDRLAVKKGEAWGVVDLSGGVIFEPQWTDLSEAGGTVCVTCSMNRLGLVDVSGGTVLQLPVWSQIGQSYVDEEGTARLEAPVFCDGLIRARDTSGSWGYLNDQGEVKIAAQYADAREFSNGLAAVKTSAGIGTLIDTDGTEAYFTNESYFSYRYASDYARAQILLEEGDPAAAAQIFESLGDYSDAREQAEAARQAAGN